MNKQRKEKLNQRAHAWAIPRYAVCDDHNEGMQVYSRYDLAHLGFEAGYRAAMRDARKAIFPGGDALDTVDRARRFLRPLR